MPEAGNAIPFSLLFFARLTQPIDDHSGYDDQTYDNSLPIGMDVEQIQAVSKYAHQERSTECAAYTAASAGQ